MRPTANQSTSRTSAPGRSLHRTQTILLASLLAIFPAVHAGDWPMWRHDPGRSGATDESLPSELQLRWIRQAAPLVPAWQEDPRLHYDAVYEPVVSRGMMFVSSSHNDSITAYDAESGTERWRFLAGGPVRFAPIAHDGLLLFGADDGCFYCLDQLTGQQIWKFQAAPNGRRVLGNGRMISVWPVRGGAVLRDGRIWFTAGVWPFEGTFLCGFDVADARQAANASTIEPVTHLRDSGLQNVTIETMDGLTPQGYLVAADQRLIIPCGRSNAAVRQLSGESVALKVPAYSTHGSTNYHVSATGRFLFHGSLNFDLETSKQIPLEAGFPVFADNVLYFGKNGTLHAQDLSSPRTVVKKDRRGNDVNELEFDSLWNIPNQQIHPIPTEAADPKWLAQWLTMNPVRIDLKAGHRLYGHQGKRLFAVELPHDTTSAAGATESTTPAAPQVVWRNKIDSVPQSMLAADGKLFVVTTDGKTYCFGSATSAAPGSDAVTRHQDVPSALQSNEHWRSKAERILTETDAREGYCLVPGAGSGGLIQELASASSLQFVVVEPDAKAAEALRYRLDRQGLYGTRVTVINSSLHQAGLPSYFASLVVSEDGFGSGSLTSSEDMHAVFRSTRPYGGTWMLPHTEDQHGSFQSTVTGLHLVNATMTRVGEFSRVSRNGSLPGAANWTHEYGDSSNSLMSRDELVKAPLGVLWFGGPSAQGELFYNRHFWPPSMAVVDGRMFIQGPGKLTAVDVYTGRILWQRLFEDKEGYRPGRRGNDFEDQLSGFHFLAVEDGIYFVMVDHCVRINPVNGETLAEFRYENPADKWGAVQVEGGLLIAELFRQTEKYGLMPVEIVVMDRYSGEKKWSRAAELSFPLHAVSGDRVFCFDGALEDFYRDWKRKGLLPKASDNKTLVAFDLQTGRELWRVPSEKVVTWLSFSREHNILMASSRDGMGAYFGGDGYQLWEKQASAEGFKGHPENLWDKIILWKDQILDQRGPGRAYSIQTGLPVQRLHPITKDKVDWEFTKTGHHCNYAVANPYLMTFRADTAGYCEVDGANTGRLEGFRSGCRNSLIPASGVLNAPNFAEGCICGYPLFTSLSLVHLPEAERWSYSALKVDTKKDGIRQLGISFGAPGDHQEESGTYWIGYPGKVTSPPVVGVQLEGQATYFRHHTAEFADPSKDASDRHTRQLFNSGVEGITRITIPVGSGGERIYTVRMYFAEPNRAAKTGDRVFSVLLQDRAVLKDFDFTDAGSPAASVYGHGRILTEFTGIPATDSINITLKQVAGKPLICAVELIQEDKSVSIPIPDRLENKSRPNP